MENDTELVVPILDTLSNLKFTEILMVFFILFYLLLK